LQIVWRHLDVERLVILFLLLIPSPEQIRYATSYIIRARSQR
jgi:hypothetical protein